MFLKEQGRRDLKKQFLEEYHSYSLGLKQVLQIKKKTKKRLIKESS